MDASTCLFSNGVEFIEFARVVKFDPQEILSKLPL